MGASPGLENRGFFLVRSIPFAKPDFGWLNQGSFWVRSTCFNGSVPRLVESGR